jgi:hypothetical protein
LRAALSQDIEAICEVLEKEHNDITQALTRGRDVGGGNERRSSRASERRRSSGGALGLLPTSNALSTPLSDHEEVHSRIGVIEETLRCVR